MRTLDRTAVVESPTATRDAYGATIPGWAEVATVRAAIGPVQGNELRLDGAVSAVQLHMLTLRWRADITAKCRVLIDGRTLNIRSMAEVGRRRLLKLVCEETT